jgi:formylglycine-generating enzyme required for sulfatase activity
MSSTRPAFDGLYGGRYILVEPGRFLMGDADERGSKIERPAIETEILDPFFLGERPVTQAHWQSIMGLNPSKFQEGWAAGLRPVEMISWDDAQIFISKMNEAEQNTVRLGLTGTWRLPSEAEWEYAARANTDSRWSFGDRDSELNDYGWHAGNAGATTREVGQKKANPWGFLDLHGQTGEWCQDDYAPNYEQHSGTQHAHISSKTTRKVHRGGSWFTESDSTRSRARASALRDHRGDGIGLRLVWSPTAEGAKDTDVDA